MRIYCSEGMRSRIVDCVAPVLEALKPHLDFFSEPEVFELSNGQVRIELCALHGELPCGVVGDIYRISSDICSDHKSVSFVQANAQAAGDLRITIQKELP